MYKWKQFLFLLGIEPRYPSLEIRNPQDPRQKHRYLDQDSNMWLSVLTPCNNLKVLFPTALAFVMFMAVNRLSESTRQVFLVLLSAVYVTCPEYHSCFHVIVFPDVWLYHTWHKKRVTHHCNNRRLHVRWNISQLKSISSRWRHLRGSEHYTRIGKSDIKRWR